MAYNQYPASYEPNTSYYIPGDYYNHPLPDDYISPNSAAAEFGLTPADVALMLQEQRELMRDELAQPQAQPTTYHNHTTQAKSPQRPPYPSYYIHPNSAAAECGLTPAEAVEMDADCTREQDEWLEATYGADRFDRKVQESQEEQEGYILDSQGKEDKG
jgi:hypothetical protein